MTSLNLRFGEHLVRVATDSRRAGRLLRTALAEHIEGSATEADLAFVLDGPAGFRRTHRLVDRGGFVLSQGRGLDAGISALANHLTALLPPPSGAVRVRARAVVAGDRAVVCLFPLLFFPLLEARDLARAGFEPIHRLAPDINARTGRVVNPPLPWPALAALRPADTHATSAGSRDVAAIVSAAPHGSPPASPAGVVALLAAEALAGSPADLLDAAVRVVDGAQLVSVAPEDGQLLDMLAGLIRAS